MIHRFMVTDLDANIGKTQGKLDLEKFEGRITLAPADDIDGWDEITLRFDDETDFGQFQLGEIYQISLAKETVVAGSGASGVTAS